MEPGQPKPPQTPNSCHTLNYRNFSLPGPSFVFIHLAFGFLATSSENSQVRAWQKQLALLGERAEVPRKLPGVTGVLRCSQSRTPSWKSLHFPRQREALVLGGWESSSHSCPGSLFYLPIQPAVAASALWITELKRQGLCLQDTFVNKLRSLL